jgi:hypothetical protein
MMLVAGDKEVANHNLSLRVLENPPDSSWPGKDRGPFSPTIIADSVHDMDGERQTHIIQEF